MNSDFIEQWVKIGLSAKSKVQTDCTDLDFLDQCTNCEKVYMFIFHTNLNS